MTEINTNLTTWTTKDFTRYLQAESLRIHNAEYKPMRSWQVEQGLLANLIGTKTGSKPRIYSNEIVKAFIDECNADYTPKAAYPTIPFGFMWTYKKHVLEALVAKSERTKSTEKEAESLDEKVAEVLSWL